MFSNTKIITSVFVALSFLGCDSHTSSTKTKDNNSTTPITASSVLNLDDYEVSNLNTTQKYALAYMWNEEKLAYELYIELNKIHPNIKFTNIANKSEINHIQYVENLIQRYDINISNLGDFTISYSKEELEALPVGEFGVPEIQTLYNTLYNEGTTGLTEALKVGCKVEVTDVNDLNDYIEDAGDAQDLVDTFKILRAGSYNHYWGFDNALKMDAGISNGCCSLGDEYCKTSSEYPKTH